MARSLAGMLGAALLIIVCASNFVTVDAYNAYYCDWSEWGECSESCGDGRQTRSRVQSWATFDYASECNGDGRGYTEERGCNTDPCTGLSTGAIVGIVLGSVGGLFLILLLLCCCMCACPYMGGGGGWGGGGGGDPWGCGSICCFPPEPTVIIEKPHLPEPQVHPVGIPVPVPVPVPDPHYQHLPCNTHHGWRPANHSPLGYYGHDWLKPDRVSYGHHPYALTY